MKSMQYVCVVALGLVALVAPQANWADTLSNTFILGGAGEADSFGRCNFGPCPTRPNLVFTPDSTITLPLDGTNIITASNIHLVGLPDTFTSVPNVSNGSSGWVWVGSAGDVLTVVPSGPVVDLFPNKFPLQPWRFNVSVTVAGPNWQATGSTQAFTGLYPEPSSYLLMGTGFAAMIGMLRKRRRTLTSNPD